jgi:heme exporter protein C
MKNFAIGLYVLITLLLLIYGFNQAIFIAPTDGMQGEIQRIFYYHVPHAMISFLFFAISLIGSILFLARRHSNPAGAQSADALAVAAAEVGVLYCTIVLITGPIWARPVWGIWWTWDARLTTTLVLWLIYVSYLLLRRFVSGPQMQTLAAVLSIFGALDVPIVYMSNRWWRTQHPSPIFGGDQNSGLDPTMKIAWLWNIVAWLAWGLLILYLRYRVERKSQSIIAIQSEAALNAD